MKKLANKNYLGISLIYGILFVVLNVLVFTIFKPWNFDVKALQSAFWASYAFLIVAFILQFATIFMIGKKDGVHAVFMGIPLVGISAGYFVVELIVSVLFMVLAAFKVKTPLTLVVVLQVIILAIFLVMAIIALMTKNTVSSIDTKQKQSVKNIRTLVDGVEIAASACADVEVKRLINKFAEDIRYSDPMSIDATMTLDNKLAYIVDELKNAVVDGNYDEAKKLINQGKLTVLERNKIISNNK